jgi:hypothetical protein
MVKAGEGSLKVKQNDGTFPAFNVDSLGLHINFDNILRNQTIV